MTPAPHYNFHALNGLRGFAAISVVLYHSQALFGMAVAPSGYLAVDVFFVLSGAVIAHAYGERIEKGELNFLGFLKLRLIRFLPLYWVGLVLGIILALALIVAKSPDALGSSDLFLASLSALFFLPFLGGSATMDMFPLNVPSWTLFFELLVNMIFVALYRNLNTRVLMGICLISGIIFSLGIYANEGANFGPSLNDFVISFCRVTFAFSMGVLLYRARRPVAVSPALVIALVSISFFIPVSDQLRPAYDFLLVIVVFPLALFCLLGGVQNRWVPAFTILGDMSYALYAIHWPLIWLFNGFLNNTNIPRLPATLFFLVSLVIGCVIIERCLDRPLRKKIRVRMK